MFFGSVEVKPLMDILGINSLAGNDCPFKNYFGFSGEEVFERYSQKGKELQLTLYEKWCSCKTFKDQSKRYSCHSVTSFFQSAERISFFGDYIKKIMHIEAFKSNGIKEELQLILSLQKAGAIYPIHHFDQEHFKILRFIDDNSNIY